MTPPTGPFSTAGDPELDRLLKNFQQELTAIEGLRDQITSVVGRGEAAEGRVVVTVTQTGALTGLSIDPRAMRLGSGELAAAILEAAASAALAAEQEANDMVAPFIAGTPLNEDGTGGTRWR
ncbi:hypothetical protein GCM10009850_102970 [Nonomuraea monospora]|uniref:YbaB/EbfC family nucleoid-associated protein n=1 Tax=Nonomuraea monospora TaxID=568818 RepID=A0ABP5PT30_9ACTN